MWEVRGTKKLDCKQSIPFRIFFEFLFEQAWELNTLGVSRKKMIVSNQIFPAFSGARLGVFRVRPPKVWPCSAFVLGVRASGACSGARLGAGLGSGLRAQAWGLRVPGLGAQGGRQISAGFPGNRVFFEGGESWHYRLYRL